MSPITRTNYMKDLVNFLEAWDKPGRPDNQKPVDLITTRFGNINSTGVIGDYRGHALTRWHPKFKDSIEPGVRTLVHTFVDRFDWVTYSSCQGHLYEGHSETPIERNVGIVPRTDNESIIIAKALGEVVEKVNSQLFHLPIYMEFLLHTLEGEGLVKPALDLRFCRHQSASWEEYFEHLEEATDTMLEALSEIATVSI